MASRAVPAHFSLLISRLLLILAGISIAALSASDTNYSTNTTNEKLKELTRQNAASTNARSCSFTLANHF